MCVMNSGGNIASLLMAVVVSKLIAWKNALMRIKKIPARNTEKAFITSGEQLGALKDSPEREECSKNHSICKNDR